MEKLINYGIVFKVLSRNLFIIAGSLLVCVGVAMHYAEDVMPLIFTALIAFFCGLLFHLVGPKEDEHVKIQRKDAFLTVTLSWVTLCLVGALPYIFSGSMSYFVDAFFESVSGFSTTGASILMDVEILPKSILFWRSLTHWIGGIGIIVLVIIIMPTLQIGGYQLFTLESSLQDKIRAKIKSVGRRLLFIYIILTVAEIIFLLAGSMSLFDSVCHAFGTVATGGFSTKNSSIINYSPYIQYVIAIFMLLAGTNFAIHYYLFKRDFKKIQENEELKFYLAVVGILGLIITLSLVVKMDMPWEQSFRLAYFQIISIITCTGFATADYLQWPQYIWMLIFFSMFLGGSTGSTAGGIKMARHLLLFKNIGKIFRQALAPHAVIPIRLNKNIVPLKTNNAVLTFVSAYLIVFSIGSLSLAMLGIDGETAASSVATCMAGIGPGIGTVGPVSNFAHLPDMAKVILSIMMLLGRLEIYTILILFTGEFWKK
jgi:trk system potassium uptake protein